ncbi:MAG: fasciclin domain-containing protein [Flavobacterium sp.]|jgi:uncharacterized surface protein with fasciclin (FAS1) repeats|nr:fasciclin domain-containing protein [Flavobacterium sp.]
MKNYAKLIKLTLLVVSSTLMFSCSDDDSTADNNSIADIASGNSNFSVLVDALGRANLASTLDQSGSFTVFAPTNDAFQSFLSAKGFSSLNDVPVDVLRQILLNHVVSGTNLSGSLQTGYVKTLALGSASTTNNLSMFVNVTNSGVRLNGVASVTTADIRASNGVIHVVDAVIDLPTIVTHATANPNFSTLVGALTSTGQPDFVGILSGNTNAPFTVFAPSNDAFARFENQNPGTLASLTPAQLTAVLTYHVVTGANVLSTGIPSGPITTFETGTFTVNGTTITDEAGRQTNIVAVDVQAANGVIHVLDNVILPNLN